MFRSVSATDDAGCKEAGGFPESGEMVVGEAVRDYLSAVQN